MAERAAGRWGSKASCDEAQLTLAVNVRSMLVGLDLPSLLVTSTRSGEGRTTISVALARSLGRIGLRVVLVDLDLRSPSCHEVLDVENHLGASDIVLGRGRLGDGLQAVALGAGTAGGRLHVVTAGRDVPEPAELLAHPRTARLLQRLATDADAVVVDGPPTLAGAEALAIAGMVGGALLVLDPRRTTTAAVERARDLLHRNGGDHLGLVVNRVRRTDAATVER